MAIGAMLQKAYAILDIKSIDADQRVITGIASTPEPDRVGDVMHPKGAKFQLPMPLLWQHKQDQPIGEVFAADVKSDGIYIKARIATIEEPGKLKDRVDEAWQTMKAGLVRGLSIGWKPIKEVYDKVRNGFDYPEWDWFELSAVTIPMNQSATIQSVKSFDTGAASGALSATSAGVSALSRVVSTRPERPMKKSYADQIVDFQNTRAAKAAKMDALLEKSAESGTTLDAADKETHDTLADEIKEIDEHLTRLDAADKREKAAALAVKGTTSTTGSESRGVTRITVEKKLPPGIAFARYAMCMGMARGNPFEAKELARQNYGDDAHGIVGLIDLQTKGAVGALNAQTAGAGSELVPYNILDDFITYLRPRTILGKFGTTVNGTTYPSLRRVPFNVRVSGFSAGASATWVGEGLPALLSKPTSTSNTLTWSKLAALTVLTKEEIRFSNPSAESKVRDDLAASIIQKQDLDFIDPVRVAVANVSPASVTWNTTPVLTTGTNAAALRTDLATLLATFATAKLSPEDIVLIMSTVDALNISLMLNSLALPVFPSITMAGGTLLGFPVITTEAMVSIGSPVSTIIVAVKAGDIYLADDGMVTVEASDQASIEMVDSSSVSGITGTGASVVSLWQTGMVGLKATREINWKIRRTGAARYIYNAAYRA